MPVSVPNCFDLILFEYVFIYFILFDLILNYLIRIYLIIRISHWGSSIIRSSSKVKSWRLYGKITGRGKSHHDVDQPILRLEQNLLGSKKYRCTLSGLWQYVLQRFHV